MPPISRSLVKGANYFFGSANCQCLSFVPSSDRVRTAPVSSDYGCVCMTDRARHPSGSSIGPTGASPWRHGRPRRTLVPPRIQKNFAEPWLPACRRQSPDGLRCGRSAVTAAGDGDPASNSVQLVAAPVTVFGSPDRRRPQANSSGKVSILKSNDQPNRSTTSGFAVNASKLSGIWVRRRFVHDTAHLS